MEDAIVSPRRFNEPSHEPSGEAKGLTMSLDARSALQYDRITQDRYIRVIDLAPGTWDEPVTCSLRAVHLDDDDLRYEAISYAWGDPTDRKTIMCNGCDVSVTRSLFEALQRFRYTFTIRTLWADALCINQADNNERTSQVRLMRFIYTRAARVLVWLEHDNDQVVQDALNAICRYVVRSDGFADFPQLRMQEQSSQILYKWRGVPVTSVSEDDSPDITLAAINALRHVCSSSWFRRGWVIQEVALGTSASVHRGHAEIGLEWLGIAIRCCITSPSVSMWGFSFGMMQCYYLFEMSPSLNNFGAPQKSWFALLHATMGVFFSEPKDRIYGLLGLKTVDYNPPDGRLLVDPDYNITTAECYRRVAGRLLSGPYDLRVLSWAGRPSILVKDLPSWVPDWSGSRITLFGDVPDPTWLTLEKPGLPDISETVKGDASCIQIAGFRVDTVDRQVEEFVDLGDLEKDPHGPARLQAVFRSLDQVYGQRCLACTVGNESKYRSLCSVRVANRVSEYHTFMTRDFTQNVYQPLATLRFVDDSVSTYIPSADRFFRRCLFDHPGHTLFITSTGILGLGPEAVLPGDVVVVLHGTPIPFVLRPAGDGLWRLVGECYVYDVNEGRIHREWEEKGSVSEKFCIY